MSKILEPVSVKGRYLWTGNKRFMIKGVVYQNDRRTLRSRIADPIADDCIDELKRDVELFKELGLNTLFIFNIDNHKRHDVAMQMLADAGIYVLAVLSTPWQSINRAAPYKSYKAELLEHYFKTIDCMAAYTNTLGVISGNEVINSQPSTIAAPVVRAVTRDVKRYMALAHEISGQRKLPVGYSSADVVMYIRQSFDYFTAGNRDEALDFFCFNCYSWAGKASMSISGYDRIVERFKDAHVPVFFSEYGTNTMRPRIFQETSAIYSPEMTHVFSGGIVYEFWDRASEYGIVKWKKDEDGTEKLVKLNDFMSLKKRLHNAPPDPNTDTSWIVSEVTLAKAPGFPKPSGAWKAGSRIPDSPVDWNNVRETLEMREWIDVGKELQDAMVDSLADGLGSRLNLDDRPTNIPEATTTTTTAAREINKTSDPREPAYGEDGYEGCTMFD